MKEILMSTTVKWYREALINSHYPDITEEYIDSQIVEGHIAFVKGESNASMSDMACEFYLCFKGCLPCRV
jgi:hypothetical protein